VGIGEKRMTPTPKLRFVERVDGFEQYDVKVTERHGTEVCYRPKTVRILQQWWGIEEDLSIGEWRDIPLEHEA
jgi:hypothetical protein